MLKDKHFILTLKNDERIEEEKKVFIKHNEDEDEQEEKED